MRALGGCPGRERQRRGTSLVELLVALVLFGIVGITTLRSLDHQARLHNGILAILESRSQHAAAHEAVAVELRGASTAAGDVSQLSDSAIVFRLPVGAGVACSIGAGVIDLAPDSIAAGQDFARFRTAPQSGDTAWLFDEGDTDMSADDTWIGVPVAAVSRAPGLCAGSTLVDSVLDAGRSSWRLIITGPAPPATVTPGAPIRLTRVARFALYRGGTGEHWLGFTEWQPAAGAWITIQPVSGPYLPFNTGAPQASGIALAGRDSSGALMGLAGPGTPAAISMATRTRTTRTVRMDGIARGRYSDSLHSLIGFRNSR